MTPAPRTAGDGPSTDSLTLPVLPTAPGAVDLSRAPGPDVAGTGLHDTGRHEGPHPDGGHHDGERANGDVAWDEFAPDAYWQHNYRYLRVDDTEIIRAVGAFFAGRFAGRGPSAPALRGVDVGSGSNLYPALSMLPWCAEIHLTDHSPSNVAWLREHATGTQRGPWVWQPFWDEMLAFEGYATETDPRAALARATAGNIHQQSVFTLPTGEFDIGTMFFVAESMTSFEREFDDATGKFLAALRPGAPFAAAFMDSSVGYVVDDKSFPAVKEVTEDVVNDVLIRQFGCDARVTKVQVPASDPLRDGYKGMIIAVGTTAS